MARLYPNPIPPAPPRLYTSSYPKNPVIVAGRLARTANGVKLLVELAEALEAPVNDQRNRIFFPSRTRSITPASSATLA